MSLSDDQKAKFRARAAALGHDPVTLSAKGAQYTVKHVTTLADLRALLAPQAESDRKAFSRSLARPAAASALPARRAAEHHLFGATAMTSEQEAFVARSMPTEVRTVSIEDKVLQENEVWDLGTSTSPVVVNLGTLTMKKGSRVVIRNTALSFMCQKLIRES